MESLKTKGEILEYGFALKRVNLLMQMRIAISCEILQIGNQNISNATLSKHCVKILFAYNLDA